MIVNRDFWSGTTATVTDGSSAQNEAYTYITDTLYSSINANAEKYSGEWDKTICPWKINGDADIMQTEFVLPWTNGTNWTVVKSDFHKKRRKGYTFYLSCNGSNFQDRYDQDKYFANYCGAWLSMPSVPDYDITDTVCKEWTESKFDRINPIINFDYSHIFVVPTVNGNELTPNLETNFDPTTIYNIGFIFFYKNFVGTNYVMCASIVSLNNEIDIPSWSEYNTNCFDISGMYDNGFMLTPYWVESTNFHAIPALGTRASAQSIPWRTRTEEFITGATGTGFTDTTTSGESAAATINYFPNKAVYIATGKSELWDDYEAYYDGGTSGFQYAVRRHLKSSVSYADFIEYIAKECAYLGFKFCLDSTRKNEDIDSQYYYIPEINDKGVTTGNYYAANSAEASQLINYDWSTDVYNVTPYDGTDDDEDGDPNTYDDSNTTILNPIPLDWSNDFQNYYVMSTVDVQRVAAYLYSALPTTQPVDDFLTNNPIDCVVSLMLFPFEVSRDPDYPNPIVYFGKVKGYYPDTQIELIAKGYIRGQVQEIDCGECVYYPEYGVNDFRSYEPYCDAELILPYCGSVKLSPTAIYCKTTEQNFHKIGVKYIVDLITGACIACVYLDNLLIDTVNGQIGMTVPITGIKSADMDRDITYKQAAAKTAQNTALSSLASAVVGTVNGFISAGMSPNPINIGGAALNAVTSALSYDSAEENYKTKVYDLQHIQVPFSVRGSASPLCDFRNEQFPRLLIKRPVMLDYTPEVYAHSVGYACLKTGVIKDYGAAEGETPQYIECTGIDFSGFGGTEIEKARLKACLEGGLYL